jgi:hypothetical protein
LLDAWEIVERLWRLTAPAAPDAFDVDRAAARLVDNVACGRVADDHLLDLACEVDQATTRQAASDRAAQIKHSAVGQAVAQAVTLGAELTNAIIAEHRRPAWEVLHAEACDVADTLARVDLEDAAGLIKAPAKVRNAYLQLPELVARRRAIYNAKRWANALSGRTPEHDERGWFPEFRKPLALHPSWKPPAQVPPPPGPADPQERLLWMVSPEAAIAEPWLPTIDEQDAEWWATFGYDIERIAKHHQNAVVFGSSLL